MRYRILRQDIIQGAGDDQDAAVRMARKDPNLAEHDP